MAFPRAPFRDGKATVSKGLELGLKEWHPFVKMLPSRRIPNTPRVAFTSRQNEASNRHNYITHCRPMCGTKLKLKQSEIEKTTAQATIKPPKRPRGPEHPDLRTERGI